MADNDLNLLLKEMKRTNGNVESLISLRKEEDTPKSLLAGNIFEILNATRLDNKMGDRFDKKFLDSTKKGEAISDSEKFAKSMTTFFMEGGIGHRALQALEMNLPKLHDITDKHFKKVVIDNKKNLKKLGPDVTGFSPQPPKSKKTGGPMDIFANVMGSSDFAKMKAGTLFPTDGKSKSQNKADDKKEASQEKSMLENLLEVVTHPLKSIKEGIFGLKDGLLKKGGLAALLGVVIFGFLAFFKPAADGFAALINGTRGFFSDIGKVFRGEMGMEEFLRNNLVATIITPLILMFTRIGVVLSFVGKILYRTFRNFIAIPLIIFKALEGAVNKFTESFDKGEGFVSGLFRFVEGALLGALDAVKILFFGLADLFPETDTKKVIVEMVTVAFDALKKVISIIFDGLVNELQTWAKIGGNIFSGLTGGGFGDLFGKGMYKGGAVASGSSYLVGEKGPEMFVPGRSGYIDPMNGGMGGGTTVINNIVNQSSTSTNTSHSNFNITDSQQEITGL